MGVGVEGITSLVPTPHTVFTADTVTFVLPTQAH